MQRILLVAGLVALAASAARPGEAAFVTERIAAGLDAPTFLTHAPGDPNRVFVALRGGDIRIFDLTTDTLLPTPFLSISGVLTSGEHGLLGLAFDPNYQTNGLFYTYHSTSGGAFGQGVTNVVKWQVQGSPATSNLADGSSAVSVLSIDQPQNNHNGGWIGFSPNNGLLYVGVGDGGNGNDQSTGHTEPGGNAQDIDANLLGKILRIDVHGDDFADPNRNYAIPASNPFVGAAGDDEIWAYGLRNPFRNSFDRQTGDLYIGDVGQNNWEEVDVQLASSAGGENYGWRAREGLVATPTGGVGDVKPTGAIDPIYVYGHGGGPLQGSSITGGMVYRGPIAELQGQYFFADYVNNRIWSLAFDGSDPTTHNGTNYSNFIDRTSQFTPDAGSINNIVAFGEDLAGNLYIVDIGGEIFRLTQLEVDAVPEPATLSLAVAAVAGILACVCKRRRD